ncbi:MAG TPA: signal peptidase I [Desulfuromonadaceae bacterium]|nr:signal peptidase I [Desulfuromonadaceae bacterium]
MSYGHLIQTQDNNHARPLWRTVIFGRNPKITLLRAALWAVVLLLISKFVFVPVRVSGISMLPTYHDRQVNFVNRLSYLRHEPQRGDVVAIRLSPALSTRLEAPHAMLLKRIVAMPGETVSFVGGHVMINGQMLEEPYETLECFWNIPAETLGPDEYFVVGDNRTMAEQDHTKGRCKRSQILGKVIL